MHVVGSGVMDWHAAKATNRDPKQYCQGSMTPYDIINIYIYIFIYIHDILYFRIYIEHASNFMTIIHISFVLCRPLSHGDFPT